MGFAHYVAIAAWSILPASISMQSIWEPNQQTELAVVEHIAFDISLGEFNRARLTMRRIHRWMDWTSDLCSLPIIGDEGRSFNFSTACRRHDFAYRNFKLLDRRFNCPEIQTGTICGQTSWRYGQFWNTLRRVRIDDQFQRDMFDTCTSRRKTLRIRCEAWAIAFFQGVRTIGGP